ncbi:MAG: nitric oxide synthase oxygenase, partial [Actinomycetota bacterium]|nr:nitric oxide synthase oxygenase [Actinomycetota bacterium]
MTALRDDLIPTVPHPRASGRNSLHHAAEQFLYMFHTLRPKAGPVDTRLAKVRAEIAATGTYKHTPAELAFGARVALRESGWCPDGVPWRDLLVRDLRGVRDSA